MSKNWYSRMAMLLGALTIWGLLAYAADLPAAKSGEYRILNYQELDWKVSGSMPMGTATHEYHLIHEDASTRGIQTLVRFSKGYVLPAHRHSHDETIVVLRGKLSVVIGGKTTTLAPRGYAVIPAETEHSLVAEGRAGCELLVSFSGPVDFKGLDPAP